MPRKTHAVLEAKKKANLLLGLKGEEFTPEFRQGVISMIEAILHSTGNYRGFKYRYSEWDMERHELKADYDDSRREYY